MRPLTLSDNFIQNTHEMKKPSLYAGTSNLNSANHNHPKKTFSQEGKENRQKIFLKDVWALKMITT